MTGRTWRRIWFWMLLAFFVASLGIEVTSILMHPFGEGAVTAWTLSDTIRDWQVAHPWLRWAVGAAFAGLWLHWFARRNRGT